MEYESDSIRAKRWAPAGPAGESDSAVSTPNFFRPHPNLADSVNSNIAEAEIEGGARLDGIPVGTFIEIQTQHRHYFIEYRGEGEALISGHPRFCPMPTLVHIAGSTWGGSMLWMRFIGRGMRLEFAHPIYGRITTSKISDIRIVDRDHSPAQRPLKSSFHPEFN